MVAARIGPGWSRSPGNMESAALPARAFQFGPPMSLPNKSLVHLRASRCEIYHKPGFPARRIPLRFPCDFLGIGPLRPKLRGVGRFQDLREDESMPLICPTCQLAVKASMPAACAFAWGCFRYFSECAGRKPYSARFGIPWLHKWNICSGFAAIVSCRPRQRCACVGPTATGTPQP
jgi:hypothetical protein